MASSWSSTTAAGGAAGSSAGAANSFMSIKQAIAGPTPPQSYAALVKAVLRYRQKRVYILAFAGVVLTLPASTLPVAGLETTISLLYPTVWLFLVIAFAGTLPVFVARKQYLQTTRQSLPDRFTQYRNLLFSRQARLTIAAYLLSASIFTFAYVCLITYLAPSQSYLWLVRTPGRDLLQINERFVYLTLSILVTTAIYASRQVLTARHVLTFETRDLPIPQRLNLRFVAQAPRVPAIAASSNIALLGTYLLFRRPVLRFLIYRIPGGRAVRPYLMSMLRHNGLSASLLLAAFSASTAVLLVLELCNCLADVYFSQPVAVSSFSAEPRRTLLDGLSSSDPYIKRFAFIELRQLATSEEKRRIDIFTDIKGKSFESISKACLVELGQSYRNLQRRGQSAAGRQTAAPPAASVQPSAQGRSPHNAPERMPVTNENAFRPTQRSFLDSITQPGAPTPALPSIPVPPKAQEALSKAKAAASSSLAKVPSIFQQKVEEKVPAAVTEAVVSASQTAKQAERNLLEKIKGFTPEAIRRTQYWRYLFEPLLRADVDRCLPDADLDHCAASSLTAFLIASLHEDQYGVAQGDIPKVLEAFIQYLSTLEGYAAELNRAADDGKYPAAIVRAQVSESVQPTIDVIREGIVAILQTFSAYLDDIKFPPSIAKRLQDFI